MWDGKRGMGMNVGENNALRDFFKKKKKVWRRGRKKRTRFWYQQENESGSKIHAVGNETMVKQDTWFRQGWDKNWIRAGRHRKAVTGLPAHNMRLALASPGGNETNEDGLAIAGGVVAAAVTDIAEAYWRGFGMGRRWWRSRFFRQYRGEGHSAKAKGT